MNKQEAIEVLQDMSKDSFENDYTEMVHIDDIVETINKIDETQKVVVPKFVAEWYERNKDDFNTAIYSAITGTYRKVNGENNDLLGTFETWLVYEDNSILTLVQMKLLGYEIEQEKLYTVEIPNPNNEYSMNVLIRLPSSGKIALVALHKPNTSYLKNKEYQLTESEIKEDFEWAWQWAKEV